MWYVPQVLLNLIKRHPTDPTAPLVEFILALTLTPMLLVGVGLGTLGVMHDGGWVQVPTPGSSTAQHAPGLSLLCAASLCVQCSVR